MFWAQPSSSVAGGLCSCQVALQPLPHCLLPCAPLIAGQARATVWPSGPLKSCQQPPKVLKLWRSWDWMWGRSKIDILHTHAHARTHTGSGSSLGLAVWPLASLSSQCPQPAA